MLSLLRRGADDDARFAKDFHSGKFAKPHTHDSFVEVDADGDQLRADAPGQRCHGLISTLAHQR
jgi:hypothetical protein